MPGLHAGVVEAMDRPPRFAPVRCGSDRVAHLMEPSPSTDPPNHGDPPPGPAEERSERDVEPVASDDRAEETPPRSPRDRSKIMGLGAIGVLVAAGLGLLFLSPPRAAAPAAAVVATPADSAAGPGEAIALASAVVPAAPEPPKPPPPPPWRVGSLKSDPGVDVTEGTFGKHGLVAALTGAGLSRRDVKRLVQGFEDLHRIERPAATDTFVVAREKSKGALVAFEYAISPLDVWQAKVENEDVIVKKLDLAIEHKRVSAAVVVAGDLGKAMSAAGFRSEVIDVVDDALEGHLEQGSLRAGARLRVVSNEDWIDGAFVRVRVEAVELVPPKPHAGEQSTAPVRVYYYEREPGTSHRHAPAAGYYDAKGRQPFHGQFRTPIPLARVTSRFNPKRMHPVLHTVMPHNGVDYGGATGTPIYAAGTGTVSEAGNGGPCGNMVRIEHTGGLSTAYCHMSRFAAGIHAGMRVEARQLIGYVGSTGRVTGPHLHFVVKRNGSFIDPLSIKMDGVRVLPPTDRDVFAKRRTDLDSALDGIALPSAVDVPDEAVDSQDEHEE